MNLEKLKSLLSQIDDLSRSASNIGLQLNIDIVGISAKPKQTTVAARERNSVKGLVDSMRPTTRKVMEIILAHAADGVVAKETVHANGRKHRLSNQSIGQALRRIEVLGVIRRDGELIHLITR